MHDKDKDTEALMARFLQGNCSEDEKTQFISWLNGDSEKEVPYFQMKEIFDSRNRIPASVPASYGQKPKTPHHVKRALPPKRQRPLFSRMWVRYATIFSVALTLIFVVQLWQQRTLDHSAVVYVKQMVIHNTRGVYAVSLPDGSKVWLHGATTLTYPEQFTDSIRKVDLQGEAYFAVQANEAYPFVVQTPTAKVRATGTEFNITAYPGDHVTTTTLVKGTVDVQPNQQATSIQLKPGQQAVSGIHGNELRTSNLNSTAPKSSPKIEEIPVVVQEINTELYTDWKEGVYRFKNEPFQNIALRLEKMYGVEINIEQEDLKKAAFSGMFTTDYSLKEVFEIINISNPVTYTVKDKVVSIRNKSIKK